MLGLLIASVMAKGEKAPSCLSRLRHEGTGSASELAESVIFLPGSNDQLRWRWKIEEDYSSSVLSATD